jgi:beta-galactosidase
MAPHTIDLTHPDNSFRSGHLRMGGSNPAGVEINANSRFLTRAGLPWFPITAEFHFARYPRAYWREELLKMKAGMVTVVASYIFWNYHEEKAGQFNWSGSRDLRAFVTLAGSLGLDVFPRIGPWVHGEARYGGFPDWLVRECGPQVRRDDPRYLSFARRLYTQIAAQLTGLLWKDGGPVVGIQIENELTDQPGHIATLKAIAREVGLDVPLYTMTGWGPAQVPDDEVIPVFGGYPDAFWDRHHDDWSRPCRKHYFFASIRDDNAIGADLRLSDTAPDMAYLDRYPYGTCELGGGMPPAYHRRPTIDPRDIDTIAFCKLGSGANLLGYYMYHGGTHASGVRGSLQETQESGYPNDLAPRSYDFQAPLGEFGQVRPHYHRLRRLHTFLQDFGQRLAPMPACYPAVLPAGLDDLTTPRWAVRSDGESGFLFANTYQRIEGLPGQPQCQFEVKLNTAILPIPLHPLDIPAATQLLWAFNLDLGGIRLRYATANLLCRIEIDTRPVFVFYAPDGLAPEFAFEQAELSAVSGASHQWTSVENLTLLNGLAPGPGCLLELEGKNGARAALLVLSEEDSLRLWKLDLWGQPCLLLSPASVWLDKDMHISSCDPADFWFALYPEPQRPPRQAGSSLQSSRLGIFSLYRAAVTAQTIELEIRKIQPASRARPVVIGPAGVAQAPSDAAYQNGEAWNIHFPPNALRNLREVYLCVEYTGDAARAYLRGEMIASMDQELIADDFWSGRTWEIGLRRFAPRVFSEGLELRFLPLIKDAPVYIAPESMPAFVSDQILDVRTIRAIPEYEITIQ